MPEIGLDAIVAQMKGRFPDLLGVTFLEATKERVRAELAGRDEISTLPGRVHGGALMAFADTLGAVGTVLNLPEGAFTTTLESKTNFLRALPTDGPILGECTPIHRGRNTMVWQTRITNAEGKLGALVTQTQMVIHPS